MPHKIASPQIAGSGQSERLRNPRFLQRFFDPNSFNGLAVANFSRKTVGWFLILEPDTRFEFDCQLNYFVFFLLVSLKKTYKRIKHPALL